jgi:hypothetical protein
VISRHAAPVPLADAILPGFQKMQQFADVMRQITPLPRTINYSGTAPMIAQIGRQLFKQIIGAWECLLVLSC